MSTETPEQEAQRIIAGAEEDLARYKALDKILWRERGLPEPTEEENTVKSMGK